MCIAIHIQYRWKHVPVNITQCKWSWYETMSNHYDVDMCPHPVFRRVSDIAIKERTWRTLRRFRFRDSYSCLLIAAYEVSTKIYVGFSGSDLYPTDMTQLIMKRFIIFQWMRWFIDEAGWGCHLRQYAVEGWSHLPKIHLRLLGLEN